MFVTDKSIFNLWNTNGRRNDVLNGLYSYLRIISDMRQDDKNFVWGTLPENSTQYEFYKRVIADNKDVFKKHPTFDILSPRIDQALLDFKKEKIIDILADKKIADDIDKNIEQRARHYLSNLEKIGFVDKDINITDAGYAFLNSNLLRDDLESLLPINDINLILLRQLMKLCVYTKIKENKYFYYYPIKLAFKLLLENPVMDEPTFKQIIQGINFQKINNLDNIVEEYRKFGPDLFDVDFDFDERLLCLDMLDSETFKLFFKNRKDSKTPDYYYSFYRALYIFIKEKNQTNLNCLIDVYLNNKKYIIKAFNYGQPMFSLPKNNDISLDEFLDLNCDLDFFNTDNINATLYLRHIKSKRVDLINEYFDTTKRMLNATRIFKFTNGFVYLQFKDIFELILKNSNYLDDIIGIIDTVDDSTMQKNITLLEIIDFNKLDFNKIIKKEDVLLNLKNKENKDFINHVKNKYPKEKIIKLLNMFADRNNDKVIKNLTTDSAKIPTIFEYICAIAWYYIYDEKVDLFSAIRLTLDSDYEPVTHAPGGDGDVIFTDTNVVTMLEVSLMDKNAQKRGEAEPVLRHSRSLKYRYKDKKDTLTVFIAPELDDTTINDWLDLKDSKRLVNGEIVTDIKIMPMTNIEVADILKHNIECDKLYDDILSVINNDELHFGNWRKTIIDKII